MFSDRLEITSPGTLPSELTKELFGTISVQRNPIIYRFLRDLRYVEGLGTGVPRIKSEMRNAGLPEPEFMFTGAFTRITLKNGTDGRSHRSVPQTGSAAPALSPRHLHALTYMKKHKQIKAKDYARINQVSYATAVNEINEMIARGVLKKVGEYRGAYYVINEDVPEV